MQTPGTCQKIPCPIFRINILMSANQYFKVFFKAHQSKTKKFALLPVETLMEIGTYYFISR
jgi:hypothetical protein